MIEATDGRMPQVAVNDLIEHGKCKIKNGLMVAALFPHPEQRAEVSIGLAGFAVGFAIGAMQDARKCTREQAIRLVCEEIVRQAFPKEPG